MFERVLGLEADAESVEWARRNAAAWGLAQATFEVAAVEERLLEISAVPPPAAGRTVLLDPPRGGCEQAVLAGLQQHPPAQLVYVSCNPAMLARDLARLGVGAGWRLAHLAVFNMFPQTAQFETVVILARA